MSLFLCDTNALLACEWEKSFAGTGVQVCNCRFQELQAAAIVSPANSFGFMDGGIDQAYTELFGPGVQECLQSIIKSQFAGEMLVGQAVAIPTDREQFPLLIAAPTMRVPMVIQDPIAVFLATRAALRVAANLQIESLVIPGMGTGVGRIRADWCALEMRRAYDAVVNGETFPADLAAAKAEHFRTAQEVAEARKVAA